MWYEDDIIPSEKDQGVNRIVEVLDPRSGLIPNEIDVKEQQSGQKISLQCTLGQDISSEKVFSGFSNLLENSEGLTSELALTYMHFHGYLFVLIISRLFFFLNKIKVGL